MGTSIHFVLLMLIDELSKSRDILFWNLRIQENVCPSSGQYL